MNRNLLLRYINGTCTGRERQQVEQWLEDGSYNRTLVEEMKMIWEASEKKAQPFEVDFNVERDWQMLSHRIGMETGLVEGNKLITTGRRYPHSFMNSGWTQVIRMAAVLLVAAVIGLVAWQNYSVNFSEQGEHELREIAMDKGQRANIVLTDGTNVILNADSKISVPESFLSDKREVHLLEGEAYFDVARDPEKPFLIHSGGSVIRVLGTSFSVRAYPEDDAVQVVVKEGIVSLSPESDEESGIILTVDQLGRFYFDDNRIDSREIEDVELYLSWTEGYLKFKDTPMKEVALQLERRYNVDVDFADPGVEQLRLTAELRGRSIHNVLNVISASLEIGYREVNGQNIIFSGIE